MSEQVFRGPDVNFRKELEEKGYLVVQTGLPSGLLDAVAADIWRHVGASPGDAATWYQPDVVNPRAGMVEMYHYQSMWEVRQHPALHEVFAAVYGTPELWVSIDRVAFKPPVTNDHPEFDSSGFIHWDTDINRFPDIPFHVQGVLALVDCEADMGGFQCVPGVYRDLPAFVARYPERPVPTRPDYSGYEVRRVPLRAGEIAIWSNTMLHGNGRNTSDRVRLAQYVTMAPPPGDLEQRLSSRE
ncbi:MAG TPA: phytanoyl-CoA dioxygenase family protein, partial [Acidimicrobiales bacterium]|nr:phytanoyl-CoA dioxygenase family protein [Acidimicrobiales bacterium]